MAQKSTLGNTNPFRLLTYVVPFYSTSAGAPTVDLPAFQGGLPSISNEYKRCPEVGMGKIKGTIFRFKFTMQ